MTMGINDPVRVKLSDHDLAERATMMATKLEHVKVLRKKKADDAKNTQVLIDEELDTLQALARVVLDAEEDGKQGDLFVGDAEAMQALHDVAQAACTCPEPETNPDNVSPSCPVHGIGSPAAEAAEAEREADVADAALAEEVREAADDDEDDDDDQGGNDAPEAA